MGRDGSGSRRLAKKRKLNKTTDAASTLSPKLIDGLLMSTKAGSIVGGRSVTSEGASHDQTSTSVVPPTTFFGWSKLPQKLKDEIHEWGLMERVREGGAVEIMGTEDEPSGHGIWRTEVSLLALTQAFEPLQNQVESEAAYTTVGRFLRRHTKFKATCAYLSVCL